MCESLNQPILTGTKSESSSAQSQIPETATLSASNLLPDSANATAKTGSLDGGDLASCNPVNTSGSSSERQSESKGIGGILRSFDRVVLLDLETSGLSPAYDYVMQIGAAVMDADLNVSATFSRRISLAGTKAKVSLEALAVQGVDIDSEEGKEAIQKAALEAVRLMLDGDPKFDVVRSFTAWAIEHQTMNLPVVGHNVVSFDSSFWSNLMFQTKSIHKGQALLSPIWVDTLDLARMVFPGSKLGLDVVCQKLDLPPRPGGHDALQDAILAGLAFFKMREMI